MEIVWQVLLLILGFAFLVKGADWFVDGASGIAKKLKISELVIGLTVVAFGTSAPELAVSISSAIKGSVDLTMSNVVGSNILNILLILGLSAIFCPLPVNKNLKKIDLPFLLICSSILLIFGFINNDLGRIEGIIMVCMLIGYTTFLIIYSLKHKVEDDLEQIQEQEKSKVKIWYNKMLNKTWFLIIALLVGLALIIFGADFIVNSATFLAKKIGISERVIGLTVVALGTSLPELVTSVTASIKKKPDIAIGNIVGSNIFNILMVAGLSAIIVPLKISSQILIDCCICLGVTVLLAILCYIKGSKLTRVSGIILLTCFVGYMVYLFVK